jgi:hypothetical protein
VKFIFDNNLAPKLAHELNASVSPDNEVLHFRDRFDPNTEDSVWMGKLGGDVVIVTGDVRVGKNPHEVQAWKESGHTILFLKSGWAELPFKEQLRNFNKCLPELAKAATEAQPGACFVVTTKGKITTYAALHPHA